ncbi:MAG TPA: response regulator transcription factor [Trichormus sp.]|jgi:DNA-binding response OmpR family regulator
MAKILVVEDNKMLCVTIETFLSAEQGHVVEALVSGQEALERVLFYPFDVIVLDWDLPEVTGLEICRQYRAQGGMTPILILTGKTKTTDKLLGLDTGADDYLTKPFELPELAARIRALLRRRPLVRPNVLTFGDLDVDLNTRAISKGGAAVHLFPKEFALLEFFLRHPEQVFSPDALIERIWPSDTEITADCIRPYINKLRSKLDSPDTPSLFHNVRGKGYMLKLPKAE